MFGCARFIQPKANTGTADMFRIKCGNVAHRKRQERLGGVQLVVPEKRLKHHMDLLC